ncbi:MAG: VWA domain-containing protein [Chthoniobacteraceae bacterium]
MSFAHPLWLLALALIPLLMVLYWRAQQQAKLHLKNLVPPRLQERLAGSVHRGRRALRFLLLMVALGLGIIAVAQPRYGTIENHVERKGRDVLFAIDTSKSMLSNDTAPDRLTRAKLAAEDLLNTLQGDRAGLIAFAGSAFLQAPMTIDYNAVRDSIDSLDTNIIPQGGTDITGAIQAAGDAFGKGESSNRALIIFSDGEDLQDDAVQAAKDVAGKIRIFTVGIGTTQGSLIPVPNESGGTDFVKDESGNLVKSHLDPSRLQQIAEATGGFYLQLGDSFDDMNRLYTQGIAKLAEQNIDARLSSRPIERYQWPLGAALLILAIAHLISDRRKERKPPTLPQRKVVRPVAAALAAIIALGGQARAEDAMKLYNEGKFPEAYQAYQDQLQKRPDSTALQFDVGTSAYQAEKYDEAIKSFGKVMESGDESLRTKAQYDLGASLFQRGLRQQADDDKEHDYTNASQHFSDVLKANPKNTDAKDYRDLVNKLLDELKRKQEQQKQQQQNQDQQKQDQKDQQDQQQNSDNQQSQKNQQQQPSKDQQSKDQSGQDKSQPQQDQKQSQNSQNQSGQNQQGQQQPQDKQDQSKNQEEKQNGQDQQNGRSGKQQANDRMNYQNGSPSPPPGENAQNGQNQQDKDKPPQSQAANQSQAGASPSGTPKEGKLEQAQTASGAAASPSPGGETGQAAAAAEEPGKPGEMTPEQARLLLESLKGDESKVQLNEHPATGPVLKDW